MDRLSDKVAKGGGRLWHWCPACDHLHAYRIEGDGRPMWRWNGDVQSPTLEPSMLCFTTHDEHGDPLPSGQRRTLCYYFLRGGALEFCSDSPHPWSGKTVPLPDLPAWVGSPAAQTEKDRSFA